jgi:L-seryl-tRNA(Ser) seleniumtransferase
VKNLLRALPPIHELQKEESFQRLLKESEMDSSFITQQLASVLAVIRSSILNQEWYGPMPGTKEFNVELFNQVKKLIDSQTSYTLKKVINATGTILHTNLGRARLSEEAVKHMTETAVQYSNLEYKLNEGERGSRYDHVEDLLKRITGAEAAMVVNNNAAAIFLVLRALAANKEVVVSRGQLVEIGGSFRISSIMEESGAKLVEVGTTNKTHLVDYERAINEETKMILKVHTSNFKVIGFTESVEIKELAQLTSNYKDIILYEDLGSGVLYDFRQHGIGDEPVVSEVIKSGAHLVSFSGDKLLGGPQAGIIVGKSTLIHQLKKHQLARVLRVDKMTLSALETTLMHYLKGGKELKKIPTVRDVLITQDEMKERTISFIKKLEKRTNQFTINIQQDTSQVGGGTMPEVELPTFVVVLKHLRYTSSKLAEILRTRSSNPIVVRIQKEEIKIDLRTVNEEEEQILLQALTEII